MPNICTLRRALFVVALSCCLAAPVGAFDELRIQSTAELTSGATMIVRARVDKTKKSEWFNFRQIATLEVIDVISGDSTEHKVRVAAASTVANAGDVYIEGDEVLVFLKQEPGIYRTVNYQYGMFRMDGETVHGWRNADNVAVDAPYVAVRNEILNMIAEMRSHGPSETAPAAGPEKPDENSTMPASATQPKPPKPAPGTPKVVIRPERP